MKYTVHEAKTNLSRLLEKASAGEEVVIARANERRKQTNAIKVSEGVYELTAGTICTLIENGERATLRSALLFPLPLLIPHNSWAYVDLAGSFR